MKTPLRKFIERAAINGGIVFLTYLLTECAANINLFNLDPMLSVGLGIILASASKTMQSYLETQREMKKLNQ